MIALLLVGCTAAPDPGDTAIFDVGGADHTPEETFPCGAWAPWALGRTTVFRGHDAGGEYDYDITRTVVALGEDGSVERSITYDDPFYPATGHEWGRCDTAGYILDRRTFEGEGYASESTFDPGLIHTSRPQPLGATWDDAYAESWSDGSSSTSFDYALTYEVVDVESVAVPPATVLASRVTLRDPDLGTLYTEYWFASGLGIVQYLSYDDGEIVSAWTLQSVTEPE